MRVCIKGNTWSRVLIVLYSILILSKSDMTRQTNTTATADDQNKLREKKTPLELYEAKNFSGVLTAINERLDALNQTVL